MTSDSNTNRNGAQTIDAHRNASGDAPKPKVIARYFLVVSGRRLGPLTPRGMVDAGLTATSFVWREGLKGWTSASEVPELVPLVNKLPPPPPPMMPGRTAAPASLPPRMPEAALRRAKRTEPHPLAQLIRSFGHISLWEDLVPVNAQRLPGLLRQPAFWLIVLLATLPLVFGSVQDNTVLITAFALFYSGIWGMIFCYWIRGEQIGWGWRIGTLLFTGLIGLAVLGKIDAIFATPNAAATNASGPIAAWLGWVFTVGLPEELVKAFPVVILAIILRKRLNAADVVLLSVFSGLGFAAYENVQYFSGQIARCMQSIDGYATAAAGNDSVATQTAAAQVFTALITTMLLPLVRSLTTTFAHACFTGLSGVFIAKSLQPGGQGRRVAILSSGLMIATVAHGTFDWLCNVETMLPAAVAAGAFLLLSMHLSEIEAEMAAEPLQPLSPIAAAPIDSMLLDASVQPNELSDRETVAG